MIDGLAGLLVVGFIGYAWFWWRTRSNRHQKKRTPGSAKPKAVHMRMIEPSGEYDTDVVGESHYQENLERVVGGRTEDGAEHECIATLLPEPENKHDRNAVRVEIDGMIVGYLARDDAKEFLRAARKAGMTREGLPAKALVVGGWDRGKNDRGHFGVRLDLSIYD